MPSTIPMAMAPSRASRDEYWMVLTEVVLPASSVRTSVERASPSVQSMSNSSVLTMRPGREISR